MLKKLFLVPVLVFGLFLVGCGSGEVSVSDTLKIGFIGPLTGNAANYGQDARRAVELYFERNPDIAGLPVEVIYEDAKCNGQEAATAATKLINVDGVKAIIGGVCSSETLGAAPVAEENEVLLFSSVSSSPEVTDAGDFVYRIYPSDSQVAFGLVDNLVEKGFERMAVLAENTDYAESYRQNVVAGSKEAGIEVVVDESYLPDTIDFKTLLQKVKDTNADVLVSIGQTAVSNGFTVRQARELGIDIQIYGTDTMESLQFLEIAKDAAEGALLNIVAEDDKRDGVQSFYDDFGTIESANIIALKAYDTAMILSMAIESVGYDALKIQEYFNSMDRFDGGLAGAVDFDLNGDNNAQKSSIKVVRGGEFVLVR